MSDLFDEVIVDGDYMEGVQSRWLLQAMPRPMSGGLFMAETTFECPTTVCHMTSFLAEFTIEGVSSGLLLPMYILFDDDFFETVLIGREVDNSNLGISNMIQSVSDWIVI